jgi:surface polysaccharide O-acyltransferase-like enzyme
MDLWRSFTCLSLSLGLITLYRDRFNTQGAVARFLTRSAFGVYVFHAPILIAVTRILHGWPEDAAVKFAVASVVAIVATFLFVGLIARRTPLVRAIV